MYCWRAVDFSTDIERRVCDTESIDADASINRGARKRSNLQRVAARLSAESDALRFSGTEQCFAGAPSISLWKSNVAFSMLNRSMRMPRSIEVLDDYRKLQSDAIRLHEDIDASRFSGPEQCLAGASWIFLKNSNVAFSMLNRPMRIP